MSWINCVRLHFESFFAIDSCRLSIVDIISTIIIIVIVVLSFHSTIFFFFSTFNKYFVRHRWQKLFYRYGTAYNRTCIIVRFDSTSEHIKKNLLTERRNKLIVTVEYIYMYIYISIQSVVRNLSIAIDKTAVCLNVFFFHYPIFVLHLPLLISLVRPSFSYSSSFYSFSFVSFGSLLMGWLCASPKSCQCWNPNQNI